MALSFEESKKKLSKLAATPAVMSMAAYDEPIAAYESWEKPANANSYEYYDNEYYDEKFSVVDSNKNITLNTEQINLTQESNSQYIPFEIPRYYDGFDLSRTLLAIYWVNRNGEGSFAIPVDVYCSADKIRFAWLVNDDVTAIAGQVKFEIQGSGINSRGQEYVWKTKSNDGINVIQSLKCNTFIRPDESWQNSFIQKITREKEAAESAAASVQGILEDVEALKAETQDLYDALQNGLADEAQQAVANVIDDYALKTYVDDAVEDVRNEIPTVPTQISEFTNDAGYATTQYVDDAVADVGANIPTKLSQLTNDSGYLTEHQSLEDYATKEYVRDEIEKVDVTEQLTDYALKSDIPTKVSAFENDSEYATEQYVQDEITKVDVSSQLVDYAKSADVYTKAEVDTAISNVEVDLSDYYTKTEVDTKTNTLKTDIDSNASDIVSINSAITTINQTLESIDQSPRTTYDATYGNVELGDGTTSEYMFTLWKTENGVREVQDRFQIMGGGGGSTSSVTLRISYVEGYTTPLVATVDESVIVKYNFSGEDSAGDTNLDGTASWKVGNRVVKTETVETGEREFDLSEYVTVGDNKVVLTITHATGAVATKAWTVKVVDVRLESSFDDTRKYTANEAVAFAFTPYGGVNKTVYFLLDGKEIGTKASSAAAAGLSDSFLIPAQAHGTHLFEAYMTADVNGKTVTSNRIVKDIIWYDENSDAPVISCTKQNFTIRQYEAININYTVYSSTTETPSVSLKATYINENGEVVEEYNSNLVISSNTSIWQFKTDVLGEHTLTITCGNTVKTLIATVVELGIDVSPITAGLVFDFNPVGYSNDDENRLWSYNDITMSVSDDFDWVNGGYLYDENGDQCFCIKAGTSAEIDYELFGDDAKTNGKQFKLIFKTKNVSNGETTFLSCVSDTIGTDKIGLEMKAHEATIYAKTDNLPLPYAEEEIIEFEFNIAANSESPAMVMGYEDGVSTRPLVYDDTHDFQQYQGYRKTISLGSDECDLYIYRFKVYNKSLSDKDILNNFVADALSAEEMIARYDRNQIYKEGVLDPDYLAEACPDLRIMKLEVPHFTKDKDDKVYDANIQSILECIYKGGDPIYDNWVAYDIVHSGQGTSSNNYGPAGRNMDFIIKPYKDYGNNPYIILGDGTRVNKVSLTRKSVPINYFNVKVNIASSENANNALLAKRYNTYNPYKRPFVREDASIIPCIKDTMEFQNCVIFVKESDPDLTTHVEFNDNNWHFYAIGNIGDSKKGDDTRLTDPSDPYECILEVMDNTLPNSTMPTGKVDESGTPIYPIAPSEWTIGNSAYDSLHADKFDETKADKKENGLADTYGWRYIYEDGTDEENEAAKAYVENKWKEFYEFVVTATDEEFKAHLGDYCVLDSVLYYYLFTLRYTMTDNHAKNSFWHYGKSNDLDADGNPIRKWDLCFDYDNDTALGIDNYGRMTYRYGYEEIDYVDGTSDWVWNAPQHVFFLRIRELFDDELCELYTELESTGCWSATSLINQFNEWQMQFPEELWRLDIQRKYIRTYTESYIGGKAYPEFLTERANGRKKTQRSQFEKNQEKYMSSKFSGTVASADDIILRCSVPNTTLAVQPNFDMHLTPFSYVYLNVKYNTAPPEKIRAVPNQEYTIKYSDTLADIIEIYSASCLKSIGDLSACYLTNGTFANATKIKELKLGNSTKGYNNTNVMTLGLGSNELLTKLDIQNMSGLTHSLDLSGLKNLEELYAFGSGTSGVIFADGGNIRIAEIPDVGTLQMKNLNDLTDEGFESASYHSLSRLVAENSELDLVELINNSPNLRQVRLVGIDWELSNNATGEIPLLDRLYALAGVNNTGGNIDQSVLTGKIHVPIIKQKYLENYNIAWPDLEISYNTMIEQYTVTFMNQDNTVLDVQYVEKGTKPVDPITRADKPIATPTLASTISTNYTFAGWDRVFTDIFADTIIYATYTETVRKYTVKYVSYNNVLQETQADYGTIVTYTGATPTYTAEESAYKYYLFDSWDQGGYVTGDKTINAVYDSCAYVQDYFSGKELSDMRPVEIYMMTKLGAAGVISITDYVRAKDSLTIKLGNDFSYTDIEEQILIAEPTVFNGTNHVDTGVQLLSEDRDFVLAIDCKMDSANTTNAVLAQCFSGLDTSGFKLSYGNGVKLAWGSSAVTPISADSREMVVLRHLKGDDGLYVYISNVRGNSSYYVNLSGLHEMKHNVSLVFGCNKLEDGSYEQHAKGTVYWSKLWYADLGADICQQLVCWPHEEMSFEICFESNGTLKRYYLSDNSGARSSITLIAANVLSQPVVLNPSSTNKGGWASYTLNTYLNKRVYEAFASKWKSLMKRVKIKSSIGNMSSEISTSDCYVFIPSISELDAGTTSEPYISEGTHINHFSSPAARICRTPDGTAVKYWTRSPNVGQTSYVYRIDPDGLSRAITQMSDAETYARIMISI